MLLSTAFFAPAFAETPAGGGFEASVSPPGSPGEGALAVVPFGVCQFVWGKPGRGITYAGTQALGLSATVLGSINGNAALEADDEEAMELWQIVAGSGVALWTASYMVQVTDGSRIAEKRAEARGEVAWATPTLDGEAARRFDSGLYRLPVAGLGVPAGFGGVDANFGVLAPPLASPLEAVQSAGVESTLP